MFCKNCGTENTGGAAFCRNCGAKINVAEGNQQSASQQSRPYQKQVYTSSASLNRNQYSFSEDKIPEEYKPISMWGYFGYELLFNIPIVGFILLIVFAITAKNKNLKNFARSYFCFLIIAIIVVLIISASVGTMGVLRYM